MTIIEAIETYQIPGADRDFDPKTATLDHGWKEHVPGTSLSGVGRIFLGMPTGFNRLGPIDGEYLPLKIFESWEDFQTAYGYDGRFNVPVWKHLDEHGNTLVRGLMPRVNTPFLHVILGDHREKIACLEITAADIAEMD